MIRRILVPLDGSVLSEAVLPVAAQLARASQGTLLLFQVYNVTSSDVILAVMEAEARRSRTYLAGVALRPELAGLQVETMTLGGAAALSILDAVQEYQVDLLVMSSHGRSGITRQVLGSVAEHVVRHAPVPVLILRGSRADALLLHEQAPVALVALDGSPLAETALLPAVEVLAALATPGEGTLHLAQVVAPPVEIRAPASSEQLVPLLEREDETLRLAERYLLRLTERLRAEGIEGHHPAITWSLHVSEDIITTLIHAGEQAGAGRREALFLALATHGRGVFERWAAGGSVVVGVLEHSTFPLLIVRAKEGQGQGSERPTT